MVTETLLNKFWQGIQTGHLDTAGTEEIAIDEGQQLQLALLERWQQKGAEHGGYKVGLTSGRARNMFGEGIRPFGFILAERILRSDAAPALSSVPGMGIENELVFRLGATLSGGAISRTDAYDAVDGVAAGFEINQVRFKGPIGQGALIADDLSQWGIVVGEFKDKAQDYDALTVNLSRDQILCETVSAEGHIDNHFDSIAALANRLHLFGKTLDEGMLVITGSFTRQKVQSPANWQGDFGEIGQVKLRVT